jgi:fatty-acyl-CoA synthase
MTATLPALFDAYTERAPDAFCLRCPDEQGDVHQLSRRELGCIVDDYARGLLELGARAGDRVVLAIDTSVEFVAAFWATLRIGAIAVPSSAAAKHFKIPQRVAQLERICAAARPRIVVVGASTARTINAIGTIPAVPAAALHAKERREVPCAPTESGDCAVLQFTSGSTADPKGCILTHRAIIENARAIIARVDVKPMDTSVIWLPLFHDMGLMTGVVVPVIGGMAMNLRPPSWFLVNPVSWLRDLGRFERSHTAVPSFALALILERIERRAPSDLRLGSVVTFVCGSEPIDPRLVRSFLAAATPFGFPADAFHAGYGMAEATLMVTSRPAGLSTHIVAKAALQASRTAIDATSSEPSLEIVNAGRPIVGASIRIVGPAGEVLADRQLGEIEIDSPSLMQGYFENERETRKVMRNRWLRSGDIGYLRDGELFVTGRARDLIIVAGSNIVPADLESAVARNTAIESLRVAAFGCAGRLGTDEIHIVIELKSRTHWDTLLPAANQACFDSCGVLPASVIPVPMGTIPRTTSGKVRRAELRAAFQNGGLAVLDDVPATPPSSHQVSRERSRNDCSASIA